MGSNHGLRELGGGGQEDTTLNAGLPAAEGGREGLSESPPVSISKNPLTAFSKFYFAESTPLLSFGNCLEFSGSLIHRAAYP